MSDGGAPSGVGGALTDDAGGGAAGAPLVNLSLDVVRRPWSGVWEPAVGAHVRIEGRQSSVEVESDEAGHVLAQVDSESGPWDVTVALAGYSVISVLGVTESLSGPIHLSGNSLPAPDPDEPRQISGTITGRRWPGSLLNLFGPGFSARDEKIGSYSMHIDPRRTPSPLRFLASEWDSYDEDAAPLNAVWVDVPETGDEGVDVVLPSPPHEVAHSKLTVELPSTGPVVGANLVPSLPSVDLKEGNYRYKVGRSQLEPAPDDDQLAFSIDAFTGDVAPNAVNVSLESAPDHGSLQQLLADIDPATEKSVSVPAAEALESSGETLDELTIGWSAPAYSHAGASIVAWEGGGSWYTYTFSGSESALRAWPHLPDGVTRDEVGLGTDDFRVNVFAVTQQGVPWDWYGQRDQRALVVSTRLSPKPPDAFNEARPTGPLYAYDGIYALTDVTLNSSACSEGDSILADESYPSYFVVVGLVSGLSVKACVDIDECKAMANSLWENEYVPAVWFVDSGFPEWPEGFTAVTASDGPEGMCTQQMYRSRSTGTKDAQRFTVETVEVPVHPPDDTGYCSPERARAAAEGVDCSRLQVYTGTFYAALY